MHYGIKSFHIQINRLEHSFLRRFKGVKRVCVTQAMQPRPRGFSKVKALLPGVPHHRAHQFLTPKSITETGRLGKTHEVVD